MKSMPKSFWLAKNGRHRLKYRLDLLAGKRLWNAQAAPGRTKTTPSSKAEQQDTLTGFVRKIGARKLRHATSKPVKA